MGCSCSPTSTPRSGSARWAPCSSAPRTGGPPCLASLTARTYATHGYRVVNQSCRGTFGSGGAIEPFIHEIDDGADTVGWLRASPGSRAASPCVGASYLGFAAWAVLMDPPPELACAVIAVTGHDNHWVAHGAGAFSLEQMLGLMDAFGNLEEGSAAGDSSPRHRGRRLRPGLRSSRSYERRTPCSPAARCRTGPGSAPRTPTTRYGGRCGWERRWNGSRFPSCSRRAGRTASSTRCSISTRRLRRRGVPVGLTIGPWTHVDVATKGMGVVTQDSLDWLAEHLAGTGPRRPDPVRIFVSGAEEWRGLPGWPPDTAEQMLYLHPHGGLGEMRRRRRPPGPSAFTYDPADPTPAVGGQVINPAIGGHRDNRALERRDDVLTFTAPPLQEPWEVIGRPVAELVHQTDNPYADLFVRLCEVRGNGRSVNLADGFRRLGPDDTPATMACCRSTRWLIASLLEPGSVSKSPAVRIPATPATSARMTIRQPAPD